MMEETIFPRISLQSLKTKVKTAYLTCPGCKRPVSKISIEELVTPDEIPQDKRKLQTLVSPPRKKVKLSQTVAHYYEYSVDVFPKMLFLLREMKEMIESVKVTASCIGDCLCRMSFEQANNKKSCEESQAGDMECFNTNDLSDLAHYVWNPSIFVQKVTLVFFGDKPSEDILKTISPKKAPFNSYTAEFDFEEANQSHTMFNSDATAYVIAVSKDTVNKQKQLFNTMCLKDKKRYNRNNVIFIAKEIDFESVKEYFLQDIKSETDVAKNFGKVGDARELLSNALASKIFDILRLIRHVFVQCMDKTTVGSFKKETRIHHKTNHEIKPLDDGDEMNEQNLQESVKTTTATLEAGVKNIDSLLQFDTRTTGDQASVHRVPSEILKQLSSLSGKGVVACGLWQDTLKIFIDKSASAGIEKGIVDVITDFMPSCIKKHKIIKIKELSIRNCAGHGDKITNENSQSGSLGTFAKKKDQENSLVALTSGHLVQTGQKIFVASEERDLLGECIYSTFGTDQYRTGDLAVVKINERYTNKCDLSYTDKHDQKHNIELYKQDRDSLTGKRVFKKGATTGWTTGQIIDFHILQENREEMVAVEGFYQPFARPGDSGSVVHMHEDNVDMPLKIVTMVEADNFSIREAAAEEDEQLSKIALTTVLNKAISRAKDDGHDLEIFSDSVSD